MAYIITQKDSYMHVKQWPSPQVKLYSEPPDTSAMYGNFIGGCDQMGFLGTTRAMAIHQAI